MGFPSMEMAECLIRNSLDSINTNCAPEHKNIFNNIPPASFLYYKGVFKVTQPFFLKAGTIAAYEKKRLSAVYFLKWLISFRTHMVPQKYLGALIP